MLDFIEMGLPFKSLLPFISDLVIEDVDVDEKQHGQN